ncbi:MAG: type II secretion system F family protein [Planctomycetaceae bacterium]|nr:type II secretion system F family protein [Planctomycetaceae bacterium]
MERTQLLLAASCAAGLGTAAATSWVLTLVGRARPTTAAAWEFESARRIELRKGNSAYRWFEPVVDELAAMYRKRGGKKLEALRTQLVAAGVALPWKPEEFMAVKLVEGAIGGMFALLFGVMIGSPIFGLALGGITAFFLQRNAVGDVAKKASKRVSLVKRRLPFAVDLMALMLEAGGGLLDGLNTLVRDLGNHPLGQELAIIVSEINLGRSLHESLTRFQQRVPDDDVAELVFMINKGNEFGTPMAQTFRLQAEQMRLKRSQWAEKAAGTAQVNIVLPGMVIMIACLIIIGAPFILEAVGL